MQKLAVFASGGGSNFRAILKAIECGSLPLICPLLITDNARAGALDIAQEYGCQTAVLRPKAFATKGDFEAALIQTLQEHSIDLVALAGYLKMIPPKVVAAFRHRMLNIHPALLPDFGGKGLYGMRVHQAVLDAGVPESGATVHFVDEEYDTGPIILQRTVPVKPGDTPQILAARVLTAEHLLYPEALRLVAEGHVHIDPSGVTVTKSS